MQVTFNMNTNLRINIQNTVILPSHNFTNNLWKIACYFGVNV